MRRIAFLCGLILGGSVIAYVLGSALIYLFTGKLSSVRMNRRPGGWCWSTWTRCTKRRRSSPERPIAGPEEDKSR